MNKKLLGEIKKRMKEIIILLDKWNYEYYILSKPSVEDGRAKVSSNCSCLVCS